MIKYLFELSLVDDNGRRKKSVYLVDELRYFEPSMDRMTNCVFLTNWLRDRTKEMRSYFRGIKGDLCLSILDTQTGNYIAGSDFIK